MEVKLIAADGCWKIESVRDDLVMLRIDLQFVLSPMLRATLAVQDDPEYTVSVQKRRYSYYSRDTHGMPIYKESI